LEIVLVSLSATGAIQEMAESKWSKKRYTTQSKCKYSSILIIFLIQELLTLRPSW